jgi:predicted lipoprotein with Yx(FWY)xxD motif
MRLLIAAATAAIALTALPLSAALSQDSAPAATAQTAIGPVLADGNGMTLYTFTRDMPGYSNCNDACAAEWPPLPAAANAKASGAWSVVARDDGKSQWAYKGRALYRYSKDAKAGDTAGAGAANGKWQPAKP